MKTIIIRKILRICALSLVQVIIYVCIINANVITESFGKQYDPESNKFNSAIREKYFVDKSELLYEVTKCENDEGFLITLPPRFGKTTNLDMIKALLGIMIDEHGNKINPERHPLYETYKQKLSIFRNEAFVKEHIFNYPILRIDIRKLFGFTDEHIQINLKEIMLESFSDHKWLLELVRLNSSRDVQATRILDIYDQLSRREYSFLTLVDAYTSFARFLRQHFNKKVILLVDEYDHPVTQALYSNASVSKISYWTKEIILSKLVKSNKNIAYSILTGVSDVPKDTVGSDFNNIISYKFLRNEKFSRYYGFSQVEVDSLFKKYGLSADIQEKVKYWYNGYLSETRDSRRYTPFSICRFFTEKPLYPKSYWAHQQQNTKYLEWGYKFQDIFTRIQILLGGGSISFELKEALDIEDVIEINNELVNGLKLYPTYIRNYYFTILFEQGLLCFSEEKGKFRIPNEEIRYFTAENVRSLETLSAPIAHAGTYVENLLKSKDYKNTDELEKALNNVANEYIRLSEDNLNYLNNEQYARAILYTVSIGQQYIILLEGSVLRLGKKSKGRFDMIIIGSVTAVILEFKCGSPLVDKVLSQAKSYLYNFTKWEKKSERKLKTIKYMAVILRKDGTFTIKCDVDPIEKHQEKVKAAEEAARKASQKKPARN